MQDTIRYTLSNTEPTSRHHRGERGRLDPWGRLDFVNFEQYVHFQSYLSTLYVGQGQFITSCQ